MTYADVMMHVPSPPMMRVQIIVKDWGGGDVFKLEGREGGEGGIGVSSWMRVRAGGGGRWRFDTSVIGCE